MRSPTIFALLAVLGRVRLCAAADRVDLQGTRPDRKQRRHSVRRRRASSTRAGGRSMCFKGEPDAALLDVNPIAGWSNFTIEALIKPRTAGSAEQRFLHIEDARAARVLLELRIVSPQEWALDTFLFDSPQSRLTLLDRTKVHSTDDVALGGIDLRRHDDDALRGRCARARGPGRLSCDGAGQDVAGRATQQGELVPGLHPGSSLHAARARGAAVADDASALSARSTRRYARVRQALDGGESPLRGGVGGDARRFVDGIQHRRRFDAIRRELLARAVAAAALGEFLPGARRERGVVLATRRVGGEARMALLQVDAAETLRRAPPSAVRRCRCTARSTAARRARTPARRAAR